MTTPAPPVPPPPPCGHSGCALPAAVHWTRRLTASELAEIPAEQQNPDMQLMVYACGPHAINLDLAAHIHQSSCSGPNAAALPTCDCVPEPLPTDGSGTKTLPTGWQITP